MLCQLKITNLLKSSEWGLEKSELPWEHRCVSRRTIGLPSFDGLRCKLTKIALFIYWVECMTSSVMSLSHILLIF